MSKLQKHTPSSIVQPFSAYSQGVEVPPNARWLYIAGQVGVKPDGKVAGGSKAQVDQAWKNVLAVLKSANMNPDDLVRVNVYITDPADVQLNRRVVEEDQQEWRSGHHYGHSKAPLTPRLERGDRSDRGEGIGIKTEGDSRRPVQSAAMQSISTRKPPMRLAMIVRRAGKSVGKYSR